MISIENIISTLSNCKFKKIQLPSSDKYSQFDCYEAKRREMAIFADGIESLNAMTDIGEVLKTDTILEELAHQYGDASIKQSELSNILGSEKLATATIDYDTYMNFQENELVTAPESIMNIINGLFSTDKVFLYGLKNPESFYKSVLVVSKPDFITKTKKNRVNEIFTFKKEISMSARDNIKSASYSKLKANGFSPDDISANLVSKETYVDDALSQATADFIGKSLIIIDVVSKSFRSYRCNFWEKEHLGDTYVIILYQGAYSPLIHVDSRNLLDGDKLLQKLLTQYEHLTHNLYESKDLEQQSMMNSNKNKMRSGLKEPYFAPDVISVNNSGMNMDEMQDKIISAIKTKNDAKVGKSNTQMQPKEINLKSAKLADLQTKATELGIDIMTPGANGKQKKKTKEQLINDITTVENNTNTTTE